MELSEVVDIIVANVTPQQTGELASLIKARVGTLPTADQKIIYDQLYGAGVDIMDAKCKTHPA